MQEKKCFFGLYYRMKQHEIQCMCYNKIGMYQVMTKINDNVARHNYLGKNTHFNNYNVHCILIYIST